MYPSNQTFIAFFFAIIALSANAQNPTQTIRGQVVDHVSHTPLPGATVMILQSDPLIGTTTDLDGNFILKKVPVGIHNLGVSYVGYDEKVLSNVQLNAGKELVLNVQIEENFQTMDEVEITARSSKSEALNEMATVSARSFSVEETQKFAAAVNDPARMVSSFAGVVTTNDGNNNISIRGNSPNGLLWRMEGMDIPNPNHYANAASSGGGIMIISSQLLSNSDFLTGAFPAEYGNALSGVFDINLRKGNNKKREYTIQASVMGIDAAAEGPISKGYNGSYLINYRYSTLNLLDHLGVDLFGASTNFQDLSFNVHLPTKKAGNFSIFGFGGLSDQTFNAERDSTVWEDSYDRYDSKFVSNTGAVGIKHDLVINSSTLLKNSVVLSANENGFDESRLTDDYDPRLLYSDRFVTTRFSYNAVVSKKFSPRLHMKSGIYVNRLGYQANMTERDTAASADEVLINADGNTFLSQAFNQWSYRLSESFTINGGVHFLYFHFNGTSSVEPRLSAKYTLDPTKSISIGYGLHGQTQPLPNYFFTANLPDGTVLRPNENLGMTKSHHFVVGYSQALSKHLHAKAEVYYQHLFNIPISTDPTSTFALMNQEWGFATESLVNNGIGRNVGVEVTVEQFLNKGLYYLATLSLYDSKYRAADGNWYNTRFNGNHVLTFTGGKSFNIGGGDMPRTLSVNLKTIWGGGFRNTPIDLNASQASGETVVIDDLAFSDQVDDYFRTDIRVSMKRQRPKSTHTLSVDVQNVTNRANVGGQYFNDETMEIEYWYQTGLIPVIAYRVEF